MYSRGLLSWHRLPNSTGGSVLRYATVLYGICSQSNLPKLKSPDATVLKPRPDVTHLAPFIRIISNTPGTETVESRAVGMYVAAVFAEVLSEDSML